MIVTIHREYHLACERCSEQYTSMDSTSPCPECGNLEARILRYTVVPPQSVNIQTSRRIFADRLAELTAQYPNTVF